jgi:FkbM family methyltransferase
MTAAYRGTAVELDPITHGYYAGYGVLDGMRRFVDANGRIESRGGGYILVEPGGYRFWCLPPDLSLLLPVLLERFVDRQYAWLNVEGKLVLDLGANVGDSALYFIQRGATKVFAYEPLPHFFEQARHNAELNGVTLDLYQTGAAASPEVRDVDPHNWSLFPSVTGAKVTLEPIGEILARLPPGELVCKVDIEGSEYEVLAVADLRRASQWLVEYHAGVQNLADLFRNQGFQVQTDGAQIGFLRAWQVGQ